MKPVTPATRFLCIFALTTLVLAAGVAVLNWEVDPLQFYRQASGKPLIAPGKRYQNPGLARNYFYNAVLIGSSLSENASAKDAHETLGLRMLNLAMSGASMHEQSLLAQVALRTRRPRTVIWEINYEYLRGRPDWVSDFDGPFPFHFYDTNRLNEIHTYLLSLDTLKSSARILLGRVGAIPWHPESLEHVQTWAWRKKFGREVVRDTWNKLAGERQMAELRGIVADLTVENMNRSFDENVLAQIRENPKVRFTLYFPPVSVLRHVLYNSVAPDATRRVVENKRHIEEAVRDLPNVELYDFQGVAEIVTNFDRYCDTGHYDIGVNRYIFDSFAKKRHLARDEDPSAIERLTDSKTPEEWLAMIGAKPLPPAPAAR